ncbi:PREDICTED: von Willebrand factor-like [Thamnophis sirtalis]|uniref:von Willebrand factor-like n=1 Tax=Thamnophis sirtalis TaxID=35019 RepID=A0A6I9XJP8_9SAUR|nr:PREDICTED: von Willebrand factor-like [Thamnophis sirtalis]
MTGQKDFSPPFARCSLFGDEHIKTFDELIYDFAGDCSYLLAGDCEKRSFLLLGDYHNGKRTSLSLYLGEYLDIHVFLNGTVTQGEKRSVFFNLEPPRVFGYEMGGILEENSYNFANSWAMSNQQKKCQRVMPPSYTCNISSEAAEKSSELQLLTWKIWGLK